MTDASTLAAHCAAREELRTTVATILMRGGDTAAARAILTLNPVNGPPPADGIKRLTAMLRAILDAEALDAAAKEIG